MRSGLPSAQGHGDRADHRQPATEDRSRTEKPGGKALWSDHQGAHPRTVCRSNCSTHEIGRASQPHRQHTRAISVTCVRNDTASSISIGAGPVCAPEQPARTDTSRHDRECDGPLTAPSGTMVRQGPLPLRARRTAQPAQGQQPDDCVVDDTGHVCRRLSAAIAKQS